jgi:hypothetical protein
MIEMLLKLLLALSCLIAVVTFGAIVALVSFSRKP